MKSFKQYIIEVATEVPKNPRFHYGFHNNYSSTTKRENKTSSHVYDYKDHNQFVQFNHAHKQPHIGIDGLEGKHHSYITFTVDSEGHRTGKEGVKSASQKLSNVSHAIGHHIDKMVEPNMDEHGEHYFSYHASKDHEDSGRNPKARAQTYYKMAKRLMKRHGYEHHATIKENNAGSILRYIYKKSGKKK